MPLWIGLRTLSETPSAVQHPVPIDRRGVLGAGTLAIGMTFLAGAAPAMALMEQGAEGREKMDLAARIARLEDIEDIHRLRNMYHYFINENLPERFREIYTEDAWLKFDDRMSWEGLDAIVAGFASMPARTPLIKQFIHNHQIDLDGDRAKSFAYFEARYATLDRKSLMVAGRYDETYKRTKAGWRITTTFVHLIYSVPLDVGWAGDNLNYFPKIEPLPPK